VEQLAHRGVDDRIAGAALAPGVEQLLVVVPLEPVVLGLVGAACVGGVVKQDVRVEVAPRQLAGERLAAALERARLELARRDAAEVQVGRQLRRAAGEVVVALLVAAEAVGEPAVGPLARRALAGREGLARLRLRRGGQAPGGQPAREVQGARRAVDLAARQLLPRPPERGEDRVGLDGAEVVRDEQPGLRARVEHRRDPAVARPRERGDVGGEVDGLGAALARQRGQLLLRPALADHEVGAALAQRLAQLRQAAVQEPRAVGGREAPAQQPPVEHEHGHDAVALAVRGCQRRVVVHAQIAPEPDEGRSTHSMGTDKRRT
jgi:hypothetical protein